MSSDFLQQLGITTPILLAPMAGSTTPELAIEVANVGAMGGHGCAALSVEKARDDIKTIKAKTQGALNVNFFCHEEMPLDAAAEQQWLNKFAPYFAECQATLPTELTAGYVSINNNPRMVDMLAEEKPTAVSFHFGVPKPEIITKLHTAGIKLFGCATSLAEAEKIDAAGLDAIVVQGIEAGGHRGVFEPSKDTQESLATLLKQISAVTKLPLIAAGGIMTGQDIAKALAAGASAVQMGTAFLLCPETKTSTAHRQALKQGNAEQTSVISVLSGRPARGFRNRLHNELDQYKHTMPAYPYPYSVTKALNQASKQQNKLDFAVHWSGTGVGKIRELPTAELVKILTQELADAK